MKNELVFKIADSVCKEATTEFAAQNPNVRFCLYQSREGQTFSPYDLVRFYNANWTGNVDFMHIPDYEKMVRNIITYPIIMAYDTKEHKILGISTLQYNEISENHIDPYFPENGAKYFSMTGVLAKCSNKEKGLRGIGNKIYLIELLTALYYKNNGHPDARIVCVIDCRNIHSIYALLKATEGLNRKFNLEEKGLEYPAIMAAYYYITGHDGLLTEAPTIVMEVELEPKKIKSTNYRRMEFHPTDGDLNLSLLSTVQNTLREDTTKIRIANPDNELGGVEVTYVPLSREDNYLRDFPMIITNGTENGKDRMPLNEGELINLFNGYGGDMHKIRTHKIEGR
jgi:hypothetical protein